LADKSHSLDRRKQVRVRLRASLLITAQTDSVSTYHVVHDPISRRNFRCEDDQRFAMGLMDGKHSLDEIQRAYEEKYRPRRLSLEELEAFAARLLEDGLAENESPLAGRLVLAREKKRRRQQLWRNLSSVLFFRIPLIDPGPALDRFQGRARLLCSYWFLALSLIVWLGALLLLAGNWNEFIARLPGYQEFFSFRFLFYFWLTLGLAKICHELGHALCCKAMGASLARAMR